MNSSVEVVTPTSIFEREQARADRGDHLGHAPRQSRTYMAEGISPDPR
jgi:hypothetical protein